MAAARARGALRLSGTSSARVSRNASSAETWPRRNTSNAGEEFRINAARPQAAQGERGREETLESGPRVSLSNSARAETLTAKKTAPAVARLKTRKGP